MAEAPVFRQLDSNGTARVGGGHRGVTEIVRSLESTVERVATAAVDSARARAANFGWDDMVSRTEAILQDVGATIR